MSAVPTHSVSTGRRPDRRALFAALDLGSNNCRLLLAEPRGGGFSVVDAFSRMVRLAEGLEQSGDLNELAIERTIAALRICAAKIRQHRPTKMRVVATEACRRARNGVDFVDRVAREVGLDIEIITPIEESLLAMGGCSALLKQDRPQALMFDIGGGSTEILWIDQPKLGPPVVRAGLSAPVGVVGLVDRFGDATATLEGYWQMRRYVSDILTPFEEAHGLADAIAEGAVQMLGASGTVTTLAAICQGLPRYDRTRVDGLDVRTADLEKVSRRLIAMTVAEREASPCIGRSRAELMVAGCAILDAILDLWPAERVTVADRGVREGILLGLMGFAAPITDGARWMRPAPAACESAP